MLRKVQEIIMKYLQTPFAFLFALLVGLTACDLSSPKNVDEIGEEAAEFVEEIGPNSERSGEVSIPTPLTTPEETVAAVEEAGGLLKLTSDAAVSTIDKWIGTLQTHPGVDDSDDLVDDLKTLKDLLLTTPIDGDKVSDVLRSLANETEDAAKDANSEVVMTLSKALEAASETLD